VVVTALIQFGKCFPEAEIFSDGNVAFPGGGTSTPVSSLSAKMPGAF
jgi:hypothetical protein